MAKHPCGWPDCKTLVDDWRWGCGTHWHMLPAHLQDKITLGDPGAYDDVQAWIIATFDVKPKAEYEPAKWERLCRMVRERDRLRQQRRARVPL